MRVTIKGGNCSKTANDLAQQFNIKLEGLLVRMQENSEDMHFSYANSYNLLYDIYMNPATYSKDLIHWIIMLHHEIKELVTSIIIVFIFFRN